MLMKRVLPLPTASTTAHITSAVVRLSMMGDRKKLMTPVIQNNCRYVKPWRTSQDRSASNTPRSLMEFTYVIAQSRNRNNSPNSMRKWRTASSASWSMPPPAYSAAMNAQMIPAPSMTGTDFLRCVNSSAITTEYDRTKTTMARMPTQCPVRSMSFSFPFPADDRLVVRVPFPGRFDPRGRPPRQVCQTPTRSTTRLAARDNFPRSFARSLPRKEAPGAQSLQR